MGDFNLKAMTDEQLVSLICKAQAALSDRAKVRSREFAEAIGRVEKFQRLADKFGRNSIATDAVDQGVSRND